MTAPGADCIVGVAIATDTQTTTRASLYLPVVMVLARIMGSLIGRLRQFTLCISDREAGQLTRNHPGRVAKGGMRRNVLDAFPIDVDFSSVAQGFDKRGAIHWPR